LTQQPFDNTCAEHDSEQSRAGNYFVATYPPFSTWSDRDIPRCKQVLASAPPTSGADVFGIYVHIPFCVKRCQYCYYMSLADKSDRDLNDYVDAITAELSMYRTCPATANRTAAFVYFGGGTPSLLSEQDISRLMIGVRNAFPPLPFCEVTFECAPQSVVSSKLCVLREGGVTRISLGVQSFDDHVLEANGRVHYVDDIRRAYADIRNAGFDYVNLDLIAGLIGETDKSFMASLDRVIKLNPESVTIYPLEVPHNTPLYRATTDKGDHHDLPSWRVKYARLENGFKRLEECGYTVRSAYAAVRSPIRHTFHYQDDQYHGANLLGLGASAFSYIEGVHAQNVPSVRRYHERLQAGELPIQRGRKLSIEEQFTREFILQLKLGGVSQQYFQDKFRIDVLSHYETTFACLESQGILVVDGGGVTLTRSGLVRVDRIIPAFYLPAHRNVSYA